MCIGREDEDDRGPTSQVLPLAVRPTILTPPETTGLFTVFADDMESLAGVLQDAGVRDVREADRGRLHSVSRK